MTSSPLRYEQVALVFLVSPSYLNLDNLDTGGPGILGISFLLLQREMPGISIREMKTQVTLTLTLTLTLIGISIREIKTEVFRTTV